MACAVIGSAIAGPLAKPASPARISAQRMGLHAFVRLCGGSTSEVFTLQSGTLTGAFTKDAIGLRSGAESIRVQYVESNLESHLAGVNPLEGHVNFFTAGASGCAAAAFNGLENRYLYRGISARFSLSGPVLKSEYLIDPGADASQLKVRYSPGAMQIQPDGALVIYTSSGHWSEEKPMAWQMIGDERRPVKAAWEIHRNGTVGFKLDSYDRKRPLVIDPVLSYSTYLANASPSSFSSATSTAVDASGNVYFAGWIEGSSLGVAATSQPANRGSIDAFVIKLNSAGAVVFATYFGGSGDDRALGIAVDPSGQAWITGSTTSSDLPILNAFQSTRLGTRNAFLAAFSPTGALVYSSYFGGSGSDSGNAIAADTSGNIYIAGDTQSVNLTVRQAAQSAFGGTQDAFVAKFNSAGGLVFSTYLGGAGLDHAAAVAVDGGGSAYVAGGTASPNFPTRSPLQRTLKGGASGFVTKLDPSGSTLTYSTFLGGSGGSLFSTEQAAGIAVDAGGEAYVAGTTSSTDFPVTASAAQKTFNGSADAYVAKLNAAGSGLIYATYLGGMSTDVATGIAIDRFGVACVVGYTSSLDFPSVSPIQASEAGRYDAFAAIVDAVGNGLYFASPLGGSDTDSANGVAVDQTGDIYIAGQTTSWNFPQAAALSRTDYSGIDAFGVKISTNDGVMFVNRAYFGVYGTAADANSLSYWTAQLSHGTTQAAVGTSLFQDPSFQSAGWYVAAAYASILGRDPDYGGFTYWTNLYRSGAISLPGCTASSSTCAQAGLLNIFMGSPEFLTRFNATDNTSFVTLLYENILARPPDAPGLAYWVQQLAAGMTRAQLVQLFIASPEFSQRFNTRIESEMIYFVFLLRNPNATELQSTTALLNSGQTVQTVIASVISSAEFTSGL